ncbi:MAG: glycosyltransferase family 4 protein [Chloroflexi bacterium]|nr:glycosyltransferase family 4 protein [Chloroflexota bacterium]
MRIGIDVSPAVNRPRAGIGRYVRSLVRRLLDLDQDNEYHLLYAGPEGALPSEFRRGKAIPRRLAPSARHLRARWLLSHWLHRGADGLLGPLDLFHATDGTAPRLEGIPVVLTVHDLAFARYPDTVKGLNRFYLSRMVASSVARADAIISVSSFTARELSSLFRLPPERVSVVPEGVEDIFHLPSGDEDTEIASLGLARPYVLAVGTLEPRKNLGTLLEAFALFRQRVPGYQLAIVGEHDWGYRPLAARLAALGLDGEARLMGSVPDEVLAGIYQRADLLVYPSRYEGFGLPPLEAMACGTPVIAANTSSIPEVVGDAGLFFAADDAGELAAKMVSLATDARQRDELRGRGLKRAASFTWERTAEMTLQLYRSVIMRNSRKSGSLVGVDA